MKDALDTANPAPPPATIPAISAEIDPEQALEVLKQIPVTDERAAQAMDRLTTLFEMNAPPGIRNFRDSLLIARYARVAGIRDVVRGIGIEVIRQAMILTQANHNDAQTLRGPKRGRRKRLVEHADQIAHASAEAREALKCINEVNKVLLAAEGSLAGLPIDNSQPDTPANPSFQPGQKVGPGITVVTQEAHFHENKPAPAEPSK